MEENKSNFDHLIKKNFEGDIQFKRVKKGDFSQNHKLLIFISRNPTS